MKYQYRRVLCAIAAICLSFLCLSAQAERADVKKLQERLLSLGFEIGKADGIAGEKTSAAILLAQTLLAENGYDVPLTGSPDAKTVELIFREENSELLQTLIRGSRGSRVKEAQRKLQDEVETFLKEKLETYSVYKYFDYRKVEENGNA